MLPFSADALAAAAPAARNSPALRAFVLPAALSYRAANSFNAAWTRRGPAAGLSHAAQLTAAWMKHARVQLQPLQILPNEGALFCPALAMRLRLAAAHFRLWAGCAACSLQDGCVHGECAVGHGGASTVAGRGRRRRRGE